MIQPTSKTTPTPGATPPAAAPAGAPAAPVAPAAPAAPPSGTAPLPGDANAVQQPGWPPVGMTQPKEDAWPSYKTLFGDVPYVKNAGDLKLKELVQAAVGVAPALDVPPLSTALKAAKLDPNAVKALQIHLKAQGYDLGPAGTDGKLGPKTYAALVAFLDNGGGPKGAPRYATGVELPGKPLKVDGHGTGVEIPPRPLKVDGHGTGVDIPPKPYKPDGHGTGVEIPPKPLTVDGHGTGVEIDAHVSGQVSVSPLPPLPAIDPGDLIGSVSAASASQNSSSGRPRKA